MAPRPAGWILALALLGTTDAADAQTLSLLPPRFELGARARGARSPEGRGLTGEEWFGVSLRGGVVDQRLLRFSLTLKPTFVQNRIENVAGSLGSNATSVGTTLQLEVLPSRPLSASIQLQRLTYGERSFGLFEGRSYTRNGFADATVRYDNPLMPLTVSARRESWGQRGTDSLPDLTLPASRYETLQLTGANRKTRFALSQTTSRNGSSLTTRFAEFQNRQEWGKGSQLQLDASLVSLSPSAGTGTRVLTLGGTVHLQHLHALASDWSAIHWITRSGDYGSTALALTSGVHWRMVPGLSVGLLGSRSHVDVGGSTERQLRIGPTAGAGFGLPLNGILSLSGTVAYQHYRSTIAEGTFLSVTGERHTVEGAGTFVLNNPDADAASVVIRGSDGTLYLPGTDYELADAGGYLQVLILPGGRLAPGAAIAADYRYRPGVPPSGPALWAQYSGTLQLLRRVRLYHHRWLVDPSDALETGPRSRSVLYQDNTTTGLLVTLPGARVTGTLRAETQHRASDRYEFRSSMVGASASTRLAPRLRGGLGADYSTTRGAGTDRFTQLGGHARLDWTPAPWRLGATMALWRSTELDQTRRVRVHLTGEAVWQPGLLRVGAYYYYRDWRSRALAGGTTYSRPTHNLMLELSRRF